MAVATSEDIKFLNVPQAVEYLSGHGFPCCKGTVRNLVHKKKLKCRRRGATGNGPLVFEYWMLDLFLSESIVSGSPAKSADRPIGSTPTARVKVARAQSEWRAQLDRELGA